MGYKVEFDALQTLSGDILRQIEVWDKALKAIYKKRKVLQNSTNMAGAGADSIKLYLDSVHGFISPILRQLLQSQYDNFLLYKADYFNNIDTKRHFIIHENELDEIKEQIALEKKNAIYVDEEITRALSSIRDIFRINYKDITSVAEVHNAICKNITLLDESIKDLEDKHYLNDFNNTEKLINSLTAFITDQKSRGRNYKTNFDKNSFIENNLLYDLYEASVAVSDQREALSSQLEIAYADEEELINILIEEREKKAKRIKWIVTIGCVIGSLVAIGAIVFTGGTATPLVVGGVSAFSSAVMSGTDNLTNQYVEHGNIIDNAGDIKWGSAIGDAAIGGVTGFITGAGGAKLGLAISEGLGGVGIIKSSLNSSSMLVRVGTNAGIGSATEVTTGIVTRGVEAGIKGESVLENAFDGNRVFFDAVIGGASGGVYGYTSVKQAQNAADEAVFNFNTERDPFGAGIDNNLVGLKKTANGGVDFSESDYILRTKAGEPIEIKITATGNRNTDHSMAEQIIKEKYDVDINALTTGKNNTYVWHYIDDYDVLTNSTTIQLVEKSAHAEISFHAGSTKQYQVANGVGYGKDSFDVDYGIEVTDKLQTVEDNINDTIDNINDMPSMNGQQFQLNDFDLKLHFKKFGFES